MDFTIKSIIYLKWKKLYFVASTKQHRNYAHGRFIRECYLIIGYTREDVQNDAVDAGGISTIDR